LWDEEVGTAGVNSVVIAKLGADGRPVWRNVLSGRVSDNESFAVDGRGNVILGSRNEVGTPFSYEITAFSGQDGQSFAHGSLPRNARVVASATNKVFISGELSPGRVIEGHTATVLETYLIKYSVLFSSPAFARYEPGLKQLLGLHDGDPIMLGRNALGRTELSRMSGASGAPLWTTTFDAGISATYRFGSSDGDAFYLVGTFGDRIDFSRTLRVETSGSSDIFVARVDANEGTIVAATQIGSAGDERIGDLLVQPCPILAGEIDGELTIGADEIDLPAKSRGAFITTMCR
jgi:hypothetical protein